MRITKRQKAAMVRAARSTWHVAAGLLAAYLAGPDGLELVPAQYQGLVLAVVVPLLAGAGKYRRGQHEYEA